MTPIIGPDQFFKKAYVINVAERKDRMIQFEQMITRINLGNIERFNAIRNVSDGVNGCAQSHLSIIRMAKEQKLDNVLIFEDDAMLVDNFSDLIGPTIKQLSERSWDFFYIGCRLIAPTVRVSSNLAKIIAAYTTHAYAVNHTLYDKILAYDPKVWKEIDVHYSFITREHESFCMVPIGAYQRPGVSDLIGGHVDYTILFDDSYRDFVKSA